MREAVMRAPIRNGRDYVLIATRAVLTAPFSELEAWVRSAVEVEDDR
jgi:hypothetical protein